MTHDDDEVAGRGLWMHTSLGGRFFPGDPRPEEVFMSDIANGLALDCRYAGQGRVDRFYSVAEHSALMADYFLRLQLPAGAFVALLHDASEAYLNDLAHSVKATVGRAYAEVEERVQDAIWRRYNLQETAEQYCHVVKDCDMRMVPLEKEAIMRYSQPWAADYLKPFSGARIRCLAPPEAKQFFASTYHVICGHLGLQPEEIEP